MAKKINLCAAATMLAVSLFAKENKEQNMEALRRSFTIDLKNIDARPNLAFRGNGMVSANNSSRLLMDYKALHPQAYREILEHIFGANGLCVNHLKIEMGSDINSSSGTEPCIKRTENEIPDVTRGAGFVLAHDAKEINPNLTLDMLWWSKPPWIEKSADIYEVCYKWYKETLDAAYKIYGLKFDYVSSTQNERDADDEWTKFLSAKLKAEKNCPYDYSKIKIVAGEEVCTWNIADRMLSDQELMNAIDVVGSHYTSFSTNNAKLLAQQNGKELWFSEGSSPMSYEAGTKRFLGSSIAGMNGVLDIATRFITMAANGRMTLYEYQPIVAAYYDGVCYCQKQMILANEPWSGRFELCAGYFMGLHFSQFIPKGWHFVKGANFSDGKAGGDGHALVDATFCYTTFADAQSGNWTSVIANTTEKKIEYEIELLNDNPSKKIFLWETCGDDYLKLVKTVSQNDGKLFVTVNPLSLVTLTTIEKNPENFPKFGESKKSQILSLPFRMETNSDFSQRGGAPFFTTDQGGAFEVVSLEGKNGIQQKITPETKAREWGATPQPTTNFGDDRWKNYSVQANIKFAPSELPEKNWAGVGLRYICAANGESGYGLRLYENGKIALFKDNEILCEKMLSQFSPREFHNIKISAKDCAVRGYLDGHEILSFCDSESACSAGRAALYSSYNQNFFSDIECAPLDSPYVERFDDSDSCFEYFGDWTHNVMSSFKNFRRTISTGKKGASLELKFAGTGFSLFGETNSRAILQIKIDDVIVEKKYKVPRCASRKLSVQKNGLEKSAHKVEVKIISGTYSLDGAEIEYDCE